MFIYQTERAFMDISTGNPASIFMNGAMIGNFWKIINSPVPSVNTWQDTLYPITGISDIGKEYEKSNKSKGIKAGDDVYLHKLPRNFIPFWGQIEDLQNFSEDNSSFAYFN
jgi:hypothetical protein